SGDVIAVTGALGRAAAGLAVLERETTPAGVAPAALDQVKAAHLRPRPRVREGQWLGAAGGVTAMIDLSDGLATDLGRICEESRVGARVELARLPEDAAARAVAAAVGADALAWATGGGADYALLVTCHPRAFTRLADGCADATGTTLPAFGEITPGQRAARSRDAPRSEPAVTRRRSQ